MSDAPVYARDFFGPIREGARKSAELIVPVVLSLLQPTSVVDVGCGTGEFLHVFQQHGVEVALGIDGDYVEREMLSIPQANFLALDISKEFKLDKTYDLAVCLEVAEHLPPEVAPVFVESLTRLAPVILFSAAIPSQGGKNHVNEQWQDYWVRLFREREFVAVDALRKRIWNNDQIEVWYRQNTLFFCREAALETYPALRKELELTNNEMLSLVHPSMYLKEVSLPGKGEWDRDTAKMKMFFFNKMMKGQENGESSS